MTFGSSGFTPFKSEEGYWVFERKVSMTFWEGSIEVSLSEKYDPSPVEKGGVKEREVLSDWVYSQDVPHHILQTLMQGLAASTITGETANRAVWDIFFTLYIKNYLKCEIKTSYGENWVKTHLPDFYNAQQALFREDV